MEYLRTPDEHFADLPDFPWDPAYVEVPSGDGGTLRMAYVGAGPADGEVVLLLHGEPSWSYLYRKMIPPLAEAGMRVIAPDLIGFGRSDKPAAQEDYSYQRHVDWTWALVEALGLRRINLFCQDWGGLIGLRLVAEHPDRFARVVAANTFMPTGDQPLGAAFDRWAEYARTSDRFDVGTLIQRACNTELSAAEVAAYDAPFPDDTYKAGARVFPGLVPARPDDPAAPANRKAWESLMQWNKPFLTAFSDNDPITRGGDGLLQAVIPGAKGMAHRTVPGGHFLQEDSGAELARTILELIAATPA